MTYTTVADGDLATPAQLNSWFDELDRSGTYINVKHPTYGAVGDGSTDDTAAIQAALDAADIAGNGADGVYIPAGVYVVSGLTIGSQVTLRGSGWGSHLFHKASSTAPLITTDDPANSVAVCIRDLLLDGNKSNQSSTLEGIYLDATGMASGTLVRHLVYNVYIRNTTGAGLRTDHPGRQSFFCNINVRASDGHGFHLAGTESHFSNCVVSNAGLQGFYVTGDSMVFVNCRAGESGQVTAANGDGFRLEDATRCSLTNCVSSSNQAHGYHFWGNASTMEGPTIVNCHSINDNQSETSKNGFQFNNVIRGQAFGAKVTTTDGPGVIYGLNFAGGATKNRIFISSQGHQTSLVHSADTDNIVNGLGVESANAETPTAANWEPGDIVDFTDSGDASGDGIYILGFDGSTWTALT